MTVADQVDLVEEPSGTDDGKKNLDLAHIVAYATLVPITIITLLVILAPLLFTSLVFVCAIYVIVLPVVLPVYLVVLCCQSRGYDYCLCGPQAQPASITLLAILIVCCILALIVAQLFNGMVCFVLILSLKFSVMSIYFIISTFMSIALLMSLPGACAQGGHDTISVDEPAEGTYSLVPNSIDDEPDLTSENV